MPTSERANRSAAGPGRAAERSESSPSEAVALERAEQLLELGCVDAGQRLELGHRARRALEHGRQQRCDALGDLLTVHRGRRSGVITIVCSSVNECITCAPPTLPIPLSVPARPPNGRCASQ